MHYRKPDKGQEFLISVDPTTNTYNTHNTHQKLGMCRNIRPSSNIFSYIYYIDSFILLLTIILNFLLYIDAKIISYRYLIIMIAIIFIFVIIYEWAVRKVSELYFPYGFIILQIVIFTYIIIWLSLFVNKFGVV